MYHSTVLTVSATGVLRGRPLGRLGGVDGAEGEGSARGRPVTPDGLPSLDGVPSPITVERGCLRGRPGPRFGPGGVGTLTGPRRGLDPFAVAVSTNDAVEVETDRLPSGIGSTGGVGFRGRPRGRGSRPDTPFSSSLAASRAFGDSGELEQMELGP